MKAPAMPPAPAPMSALSRIERFLNRAWTAGDPLVAGFSQLWEMGFSGGFMLS